jgi:hypothetical protein
VFEFEIYFDSNMHWNNDRLQSMGEMGEKSHKYELICRVNHAINLLIVGLWCPKSASIPGASLAILVLTGYSVNRSNK